MPEGIVLIRSNHVDPDPRVEKTADALLKCGYRVFVLAWDRRSNYPMRMNEKRLKFGVVQIIRTGIKGEFSGGIKKNGAGLLRFNLFIRKWLYQNKEKYDAVHAYDLDTGWSAFSVAKRLEKPFVYDIADYYVASHGLSNSKLGFIVEHMEHNVINGADAVIICSEKRKEQIAGTTPKKLIVIHNTVPKFEGNDIVVNHVRENEKMKLVYVGILAKARFIDQIAEIVALRDDCEFHVAGFGGGMETYFEEMAGRYDQIKFYGRIPYEQTLALESACDVMCAMYDPRIPNHQYAAPNKFYEGLMLGKPLIMARETGVDHYILDYDIGAVVEYSREGFSQALNTLAARRKEWADMGKRAMELYDREFSWDVMEKRLVLLYKGLLVTK